MTTSRDPERRIRAFVAEGEFELPDRVYDAVRAAVDGTARRGFARHARLSGTRMPLGFAVAAAVAVGFGIVGLSLLTAGMGGPRPAATASREPSAVATEVPPAGGEPSERTSFEVDGMAISVRIPRGWESFGSEFPSYIAKSIAGPQGAEAQVLWAAYPAIGEFAAECYYLRDRNVDATVDALTRAVSSVPGTRVVSGPTELTVAGRRASHVELVVEQDVGCDPGFFYTYPNVHGGALWPETMPGDTVRVWIVEASPRLLFLEGKTHPDAPEALVAEIQAIIDSMKFE